MPLFIGQYSNSEDGILSMLHYIEIGTYRFVRS